MTELSGFTDIDVVVEFAERDPKIPDELREELLTAIEGVRPEVTDALAGSAGESDTSKPDPAILRGASDEDLVREVLHRVPELSHGLREGVYDILTRAAPPVDGGYLVVTPRGMRGTLAAGVHEVFGCSRVGSGGSAELFERVAAALDGPSQGETGQTK